MDLEALKLKFSEMEASAKNNKDANEAMSAQMKEHATALENLKSIQAQSDEYKKQIEALQENQKAMDERLAGFKAKSQEKGNPVTTLKEAIYSSLKVKGIDSLKSFKEHLQSNKGTSIELDLKDVTIGGSITGREVYLSTLSNELGMRPYAPFRISQAMRTIPISNTSYHWVDKVDTNQAAGTPEGTAKPNAGQTFVESKIDLSKYAVHEKYSMEFMDDNDAQFFSQIVNTLAFDVQEAFEEDIIDGDGTGGAMLGLSSANYSTPFAAGSFAATIPDANIVDLIKVCYAQIANAKFVPNFVIMNPIDVAKMRLSKDSEGKYIMPVLIQADLGDSVAGLRVIETPYITENTMMVADMTKPELLQRMGVTLRFTDSNEDDFINNFVTYRAEMRGSVMNKSQFVPALIYVSDIEAAVASLATV